MAQDRRHRLDHDFFRVKHPIDDDAQQVGADLRDDDIGAAVVVLRVAKPLRVAKRPEFELYDLQTDPWELKNVADQGEHNDVITRLRARLEAWLKQQGDEPVKSEAEAYARQPGHEKKLNGPSEEEIAERKKQFERKDKNGDGKLSLEEYAGSPADDTAKLRFNRWDVDQDGALSLQEYILQQKSKPEKK